MVNFKEVKTTIITISEEKLSYAYELLKRYVVADYTEDRKGLILDIEGEFHTIIDGTTVAIRELGDCVDICIMKSNEKELASSIIAASPYDSTTEYYRDLKMYKIVERVMLVVLLKSNIAKYGDFIDDDDFVDDYFVTEESYNKYESEYKRIDKILDNTGYVEKLTPAKLIELLEKHRAYKELFGF